MKVSFNLVDSDSVIQKQILDLLRNNMDIAFKKALPKIKDRIKKEVRDALTAEPEYQSLISGKLKYEFGISSNQKIESIIDIWINNIMVNYTGIKSGTRGLNGSLSLNMIKSSYDDVLANDGAVVIDSSSGAVLPWLEWLLLYGGKIIVRDYRVQIGPNARSRTGMAIMVQSSGNNWRVPPEFAGTASNNWVTRALDKIDNKISNILETELEKAI
jgi:hypothetical protein